MTRPVKERRICADPTDYRRPGEAIELTFDEFECVRLIDFCGLTQAQCGEQMEVARTTIAAIIENARYKLAQAMLLNRPLQVEGGNVRVCEYANPQCCRTCGKGLCSRCERDCPKRFVPNHENDV